MICAILFFANIFRRTWLLPGLGVGLLLLSALLVGGVYPAVVQRFQVKPAEPDREAPYIQRNIAATRTAYNIDDAEVQDYSAKTDVTAGQLREDSDTTASIRLLDPALLSPTYRNLQQIRAYYDFPPALDVDRYTVDNERRDLVTAVRELDLTGLPPEQRNWINDHTVYTHGFGFVAALGNEPSQGRPSFVSSNIPPQGELGQFEPRIYFGEESPTYSIVGGPKGASPVELDFPDDATGTGQSNTTYTGQGRRRDRLAVAQAAVRQQVPGGQPPALGPGDTRVAHPVQPRAQGAGGAGRAVAHAGRRPLPGGGRRQDPVDRRRLHHDATATPTRRAARSRTSPPTR